MKILLYTTVIEGDDSQMYASAVEIPEDKLNAEYVDEMGNNLIKSIIRTLRHKKKITPFYEGE
jgi:hypothetical protein